ncbi:MAG TPA: BadF/BadG/BcrA/BcrD ATPase family protein [Xanthobacteraceae bacterium]|jgi:glucosamine kinase
MDPNTLLLGVDGGGTQCRARLSTSSGAALGEGTAGPANIRYGLREALAAVIEAAGKCLEEARLSSADLRRVIACLALAGASEPTNRAAAQKQGFPFARTIITTDAQAACIGAHRGRDGGIIVVGTGTIGWAELAGRPYRVGGWGLPVSDEGSGAWLGCEVLRRALWAHDGRISWTELLRRAFAQFQCDPHAVVRWIAGATPRDFGAFAPLVVEHAESGDPIALELMNLAGGHIDALAMRLIGLGAPRLALAGGLGASIEPWLSPATRKYLVCPAGDALDGALQLARAAAEAVAA